MGKVVLSKIAGLVQPYIRLSKPSEFIPFKGQFPLLEPYKYDDYLKEITSHQWLEDCEEWVQDIILKGERIAVMEDEFVQFLKENNTYVNFVQMKSSEKADELIRYMNAHSLELSSIRI